MGPGKEMKPTDAKTGICPVRRLFLRKNTILYHANISNASLEKVCLGHKVEALYRDLPALQWLTVRLAEETEHEG